MKLILSFSAMLIVLLSTIVYTSCTKDKCQGVNCLHGGACNGGNCVCPAGYTGQYCENADACSGITCLNGGTCSSGICACPTGYAGTYCETYVGSVSTITYRNNTFTPIYINVNGSTATIAVGGSVSFTGTSGDVASGTATTSGVTTSGSQVGLLMQWSISNTFASSPQTIQLNLGSDYFFLKIINNSSYTINQVYVNYALTSQTLDNVTLSNNGLTYNIGYYRAYTNSRLYLTSGTHYWDYNIGLSFTQNQSYTFTAL